MANNNRHTAHFLHMKRVNATAVGEWEQYLIKLSFLRQQLPILQQRTHLCSKQQCCTVVHNVTYDDAVQGVPYMLYICSATLKEPYGAH